MTVGMENLMSFGSQVMLQRVTYVICVLDNCIFSVASIFYYFGTKLLGYFDHFNQQRKEVIDDFVCKQNCPEEALSVLRARVTKIFAFSRKYHLTTLSSLINSSYSLAFIIHLLYIIPEIAYYSLLYFIKFYNTISITCLF